MLTVHHHFLQKHLRDLPDHELYILEESFARGTTLNAGINDLAGHLSLDRQDIVAVLTDVFDRLSQDEEMMSHCQEIVKAASLSALDFNDGAYALDMISGEANLSKNVSQIWYAEMSLEIKLANYMCGYRNTERFFQKIIEDRHQADLL